MTSEKRCLVCRAGPNRRRMVEAMWADGMSASGIAAAMADGGWKVSSSSILTHEKEHDSGAAVRKPIDIPRKDWSTYLQTMIGTEIERRFERAKTRAEEATAATGDPHDPSDFFDVLDKEFQPAFKTVLAAESNIIKRENDSKSRQVGLFVLMLGGADGQRMLAPRALIGDEDEDDALRIIEGEARAVE